MVATVAGFVVTGPSGVSKPLLASSEASSGVDATAAAWDAFACCCNEAMGCAAVCGVITGGEAGTGAALASIAVEPFAGNGGAG